MEENILVRVGADITNLVRGMKRATNNIQKFGKQTKTIAEAMKSVGNASQSTINSIDVSKANTEFRQLSKEINAMEKAFKVAEMKAILPFKKQMFDTQKKMYGLAYSMGNLNATNKEFMGAVSDLGKEYKKANDAMINANKRLGMSMIQTAGYMMNMTTQAQRISENYDRMANPMYKINAAGLAVANTLNKIANNGNAAVLALKKLGPNASMKQLRDMQMMINQGVMRFTMVALAAAASGAKLYGSLHKAAMKANKQYASSFNKMIATLRKAFDPMVQVFSDVMTRVYKFVTSIAEMVIKFNEAHPTLAKLIQGFLMLIPALTLLLSPLAIGIGLFGGMAAAFNSIWLLIGPLVTGLGAMSATVALVSGAIVALTAGINYLWKNSEGFRNAITATGEALKSFGQVIASIAKYLYEVVATGNVMNKFLKQLPKGFQNAAQMIGNGVNTIREKILNLVDAVKLAFKGDFSELAEIFSQIIPTIIGALVGGIPGLIIAASRFIPAINQGILNGAGSLSETINKIVNSITTFLTQKMPVFIAEGMKFITNLVQGITNALPIITSAIVNIITMIVNLITQMLPTLLQAGVQLVTSLINGIVQMLPTIIQTGLTLISALINTISTLIPQLLNAGMRILMTLVDGIVQNLPTIINAALQIFTTLTQAITENLPKIIDAGLKILTTLLDGIVQNLPKIVDTVITIITTLVDQITANLPKIIDAGVKILTSLIDGIVKILPKLIDSALLLITKIVETLTKNLPKIIDSGVKILTSLINGIIKVLPQLINAGLRLITSLAGAIIKNLPTIIAAGVKILKALLEGIGKIIPQLLKIGWNLVKDFSSAIGDKISSVISAGKDLIKGLWRGISDAKSWILSKIGGFVDDIVGGIKKFFGIHSPSRVLRDEVGKYLPLGLIAGIKRMKNDVISAAEQMTKWATPEVPAVSLAYSTPTGVYGSLSSAVNGTVDVDTHGNNHLLQQILSELKEQRKLTVQMDGERVGHLVRGYVNEGNAVDATIRRYFG